MAVVTTLLVRWAGGFHEVSWPGAPERHEGFLSAGNLASVEEVERVALGLLGRMHEEQEQVTVSQEPVGVGDTPYFAYGVGDYVTAPDSTGAATSQRVRSFTVKEDGQGDPVFTPQLRDAMLETEDRLLRALKRMANGSMQGRTDAAAPASSTQAGQAPQSQAGLLELPPFSYEGNLTLSSSGPYSPPTQVTITTVKVLLGTASASGTVTVVVRKNGATVATVNLAAGDTVEEASVSLAFVTTDVITCAITATGTGAEHCTVLLRL